MKDAKLSNDYVVTHSNGVPYLYRGATHVECSPIVLLEIMRMRELLEGVHSANDDATLSEALHEVDKYVMSIPK